MDNQIRTFKYANGLEVRTVNKNGDPLFVAKDVAEILGYENSRTMTRRLDDDEKGVQNLHTPGGEQELTVITESGLYNAILGSTKPEAKAFKKWVTAEVLPSIRKQGGYIAAAENDSPEMIMAKALRIANETIERAEARRRLAEEQRDIANTQIKQLLPDAQYTQEVLQAQNLHTVNSIAVQLGISAVSLNKFLREQGWIYKNGSIWYPSHKIRDCKYCDYHITKYVNRLDEVCTCELLKWTELGRKAVIELFRKVKGQ